MKTLELQRVDERNEPQDMDNTARASRLKLRRFTALLTLAGLLAAFMLLQLLLPLGTAVQIGADEGFELAKTTLCLEGHPLYSEVWNDQPPLHTFLVTKLLRWRERPPRKQADEMKTQPSLAREIEPANGGMNVVRPAQSVLWPRLPTSAFTTVLLASVFLLSSQIHGLLVAALATGLLIASPGFIELSSSCMLEIPALAAAVAPLCILVCRPQTRCRFWEAVAGIAFGLALQIKLVPAILLSLAAAVIWARWRPKAAVQPGQDGNVCRKRSRSPLHHPALPSLFVFASAFLMAYIGIDLLIEHGAFLVHFQQTWTSHFGHARSFEYGSADDHPFDWSILFKNWDTTVPASVGIIALLQKPSRRQQPPYSRVPLLHQPSSDAPTRPDHSAPVLRYLPLVWLVLTFVVFTTHRPWWPYYYVHLAIPLCWCAAIGFDHLFRAVAWPRRNRTQIGATRGAMTGGAAQKNRMRNTRPTTGPALASQPQVLPKYLLWLFVLCTLVWQAGRVYYQATSIRDSPQIYASLVLAEIQRFKASVQWMYADDPVYSFHSRIPMPPQLAVVPLKRLWSGDMTNARAVGEMEKYRPGLILLKSDAREVPFQDLIASEYQLVYQDADHRLYARKGLTRDTTGY